MINHITAAAAAALVAASGLAHADGSGQTVMSGSVPENCGVVVATPQLDINAVLVGSEAYIELDLYCNRADGATFTASSRDGGFTGVGTTTPIVYDILVDGEVVEASGTSAVPIVQPVAGVPEFIGTSFAEAAISLPAGAPTYSGQYTDVLTFAIAAGT